MTFARAALALGRPASIAHDVALPRRQRYFPSPTDWRDEILYFLLVDRFSDGNESQRPVLDRTNLGAARPDLPNGEPWRWDRWAESGALHWQGGNLRGVRSKLPYLRELGVTALWLSPVFKQRGHLDSYHGYGVQDFLDVDPHFGDRQDLVDLVAEAHEHGMRIILDVIFNHSGPNWLYPPGTPGGAWKPFYTPGHYPFGTAGQHCFDATYPVYRTVSRLAQVRSSYPALRVGRQYPRPVSFLGRPFDLYGPGEVVAWSRILDDEEVLCLFNSHGEAVRGADVLVDASLNPPGSSMTVLVNSAEDSEVHPDVVPHAAGARLAVHQTEDGNAFVQIRDLPPSTVVVLSNRPEAEEGSVRV